MSEADRQRRWVCFDVGETLIDETRVWATWAEVLEVTPLTFMAALGTVIARGQDHREVFPLVGHHDWQRYRDEFERRFGGFQAVDLYPDARPALDALRERGYRLAVIANQPSERNAELRDLGIEPDVMVMSGELGVHKPAPEFYARTLEVLNAQPADVAYVGDRLDNDVCPSQAAGMAAVWIQRGPWALLAPDIPSYLPGVLVVSSLDALVERIDEVWA